MNPWKSFAQATCLPHDCQCEIIRDEFIRQPSSTWSSLAYILSGLAIYRYVREKSMNLKMWALVCIIMGLSSMLGHASFVRFSLAIDFASIVLVMSFFSIWNLLNSLKQSPLRIFMFFSLFYLVVYGSMYSMNKWEKIAIVFVVFTFAIADVIREMGRGFLKARSLQYSLLIFAVSFGIYIMDEKKINCIPNHLFQWHSVWHMGTAISMFLYGKWRFDEIAARKTLNSPVSVKPA